MRQIGFALLLLCGAFMGRDAVAQDFWYVPPGYGGGYYYGIDLGYGVGFGYGLGVGVPVTPETLSSSVTGSSFQNEYPSNFGPSQGVYGSQVQPSPIKPFVAKGSPKKPKGVLQQSKAKGLKSTKVATK